MSLPMCVDWVARKLLRTASHSAISFAVSGRKIRLNWFVIFLCDARRIAHVWFCDAQPHPIRVPVSRQQRTWSWWSFEANDPDRAQSAKRKPKQMVVFCLPYTPETSQRHIRPRVWGGGGTRAYFAQSFYCLKFRTYEFSFHIPHLKQIKKELFVCWTIKYKTTFKCSLRTQHSYIDSISQLPGFWIYTNSKLVFRIEIRCVSGLLFRLVRRAPQPTRQPYSPLFGLVCMTGHWRGFI